MPAPQLLQIGLWKAVEKIVYIWQQCDVKETKQKVQSSQQTHHPPHIQKLIEELISCVSDLMYKYGDIAFPEFTATCDLVINELYQMCSTAGQTTLKRCLYIIGILYILQARVRALPERATAQLSVLKEQFDAWMPEDTDELGRPKPVTISESSRYRFRRLITSESTIRTLIGLAMVYKEGTPSDLRSFIEYIVRKKVDLVRPTDWPVPLGIESTTDPIWFLWGALMHFDANIYMIRFHVFVWCFAKRHRIGRIGLLLTKAQKIGTPTLQWTDAEMKLLKKLIAIPSELEKAQVEKDDKCQQNNPSNYLMNFVPRMSGDNVFDDYKHQDTRDSQLSDVNEDEYVDFVW